MLTFTRKLIIYMGVAYLAHRAFKKSQELDRPHINDLTEDPR